MSNPTQSEAMTLTPAQLRILRHMLGIDDGRKARPEPYRDYYCANPGDPELVELERLGAVRLARKPSEGMPYDTYVTTDFGREAAIRSFRTIQAPKGRRVYLRYLSVRDALPDLTFREFLTREEFADTRRTA